MCIRFALNYIKRYAKKSQFLNKSYLLYIYIFVELSEMNKNDMRALFAYTMLTIL